MGESRRKKIFTKQLDSAVNKIKDNPSWEKYSRKLPVGFFEDDFFIDFISSYIIKNDWYRMSSSEIVYEWLTVLNLEE